MSVAWLAPKFIPSTAYLGGKNGFDFKVPRIIWMWANSDGSHYLSIARNGYFSFQHGFFPFYPVLIRLVKDATGLAYPVCALLITYSALAGFLYVFYRLLRLDFDKNHSLEIISYVLVFPVAFYLVSVYTDALFLFLVTLAFYLARKKRLWAAGFLGYLATITRFPGIALFPALLVEWWVGKRKKIDLMSLLLIPLGTFNYLFYIQETTGNWRNFLDSMGIWEQDRYVFPLQTLFRYIKMFFYMRSYQLVYLIAFLEILAMLLATYLVIKGWKLVRRSYLIYAVGYLLIPLSSGTLQGVPRYFLHTIALFIIAWKLLRKSKFKILLTIAMFILQLLLVAYFSQGYFIS